MERPEGDQNSKTLVSKSDASCFIFSWLTANFEERPDALLLRPKAYELYLAHCQAMRYEHTSIAAFGKHFKRAFPNVSMKRLSRNGLAKKRYYAGVAYNPRPAPTPKSHALAITWVEENAEDIFLDVREKSPTNRRKRAREPGGGVSRAECRAEALPDNGAITNREDEVDAKDGDKEEEQEEGDDEEAEEEEEVIELGRPMTRHDRVVVRVTRGRQTATTQQQMMAIGRAGVHLGLMGMLDFYSQMYIKELWGINPINPATTDIKLLSVGARSEQSSTLALNSCLLMSSASFLAGHWTLAKHYFHRARQHLGNLFDAPDYDIACVLLPLSWWTRLYSDNFAEGLSKQAYYVALGKQICESVDARNDETYRNFACMQATLAKKDPSSLIHESKQQKPYRRSWRSVSGLTYFKPDKATSIEVRYMISQLYGVVYPICAFYQEKGWDHPGWAERKELLKQNLGIANQLEETLSEQIKADQSCTLMYSMMRCEVCAVRTFIFWALRSEHQLYAAKTFVQLLLMVPASIMVMATHEFTNHDYLLMRLPVDILVETREKTLLTLLYDTLMTHAQAFYWMRRMCQYIRQRVPNISVLLPAALPEIDGGESDLDSPLTDLVPFTSPGLSSATTPAAQASPDNRDSPLLYCPLDQ